MRFYPLTDDHTEADALAVEYAAARAIGKIRMGELRLYFKAGLRTYYIPYHDVTRCFRRILEVPAKLCCGKGDFEIENLVICGEGDRELAQIQLPGKKAAVVVMDELKARIPEAQFGRPTQKG